MTPIMYKPRVPRNDVVMEKFRQKEVRVSILVLAARVLITGLLARSLQNSSCVFFDLWHSWWPAKNPVGVAAIVIDQPSLDSMDKNDGFVYPWPRELYGALMTVAKHLNAQAVGFDILFTE